MACYQTLCQRDFFCVDGYVTNLTYTYEGCGLSPNYAKWWCCEVEPNMSPNHVESSKISMLLLIACFFFFLLR